MSETDDEGGLDLFAEVQAAGSGCASEPPPQLPQVPQLPQPAPAAGYAECALVQPPGAGYRLRKAKGGGALLAEPFDAPSSRW